jgi:hypothetical protein
MIIVPLLWLAKRNRKSGWRRVRADPEMLRQWSLHAAVRPVGVSAPGLEEMGRQLAAFQQALEAQRGPAVHEEPLPASVAVSATRLPKL